MNTKSIFIAPFFLFTIIMSCSKQNNCISDNSINPILIHLLVDSLRDEEKIMKNCLFDKELPSGISNTEIFGHTEFRNGYYNDTSITFTSLKIEGYEFIEENRDINWQSNKYYYYFYFEDKAEKAEFEKFLTYSIHYIHHGQNPSHYFKLNGQILLEFTPTI